MKRAGAHGVTQEGGFLLMDITKQVTISIREIMDLRTSIRARMRELSRMQEHYGELSGLTNEKKALEMLYEKFGSILDMI